MYLILYSAAQTKPAVFLFPLQYGDNNLAY